MREVRLDSRPLTISGLDEQYSSSSVNAFIHGSKADPASNLRQIKAGAIVANADMQSVDRVNHARLNVCRMPVTRGVRKRFLDNPQRIHFQLTVNVRIGHAGAHARLNVMSH